MPLSLQYDIVNDTPASASPVQANYNLIEQYVNQDVITRDGATAMAAQLRLVGAPVNDLDAAPKGYVDTILPVGIIMMYGGATSPPGGRWAVCNGAELEAVSYPDLYAILGNRFGGSAGRFAVPNLVDRFPIGAGAAVAGAVGGNKDATALLSHTHDYSHAHAGAQTGGHSASHTHGLGGHAHGVSINSSAQSSYHTHSSADGTYEGFTMWDAQGGGAFGASAGGGLGPVGTTGYENSSHIHLVSGNTGGPSGGSDGASNDHSHAFNTPVHNGSTAAAAAGSATDANLPPYLALSYIIRID